MNWVHVISNLKGMVLVISATGKVIPSKLIPWKLIHWKLIPWKLIPSENPYPENSPPLRNNNYYYIFIIKSKNQFPKSIHITYFVCKIPHIVDFDQIDCKFIIVNNSFWEGMSFQGMTFQGMNFRRVWVFRVWLFGYDFSGEWLFL